MINTIISSRNRMGVGVSTRKTVLGKMGKERKSVFGFWPVAVSLCILMSVCNSAAAADAEKGGYFLFAPPFGGDSPAQEVVADKRSGGGIGGENNDVTAGSRSSLASAETLWVGSHKINWNPLPSFEKFFNPSGFHQQKQQQQFAQARKYDVQEDPLPNKGKFSPFGGGEPFKGLFGSFDKHHQKKPFFQNPHHDFSKKFSTGGFFAGLGPFGPKNAPKLQPSQFIEPRSSVQPERDYALPPSSTVSSEPTTPSTQIQSSPRGTILVSPQETLFQLSTPGPSLSPIVDRLRQMTEWSRQSQNSGPVSLRLVKKEGKLNSYLENKRRLKKRLRASQKSKTHKHNIEAIILSNDDEDKGNDNNDSIEIITGKNLKFQETQQKPQTKSMKRKRKSRGRHVSKEQNERSSIEERFRALQQAQNDPFVLHPTNVAILSKESFQVQKPPRNKPQLKRKDKKVALFKNDYDSEVSANQQSPFSFRFGPEDAKVSPYSK